MKVTTPPDRVKSGPPEWMRLFSTYRIAVLDRDEVIHGVLHDDLDPDGPEVREVLDAWDGPCFLSRDEGRAYLVLVRRTGAGERPRRLVHGGLFLLTLFTTHMAGSLLLGVDPLRFVPVRILGASLLLPLRVDLAALARGSVFALPLLGILLGHELGHYLTARRYRLRVSLPYFLPFPPYFSVVGTLGAFIRLRSPMLTRRVLFDVGVAGPLASFALSLPAVVAGLLLSRVVPGAADAATPYLIRFGADALRIGESVLFGAASRLVLGEGPGAGAVLLHPLAFAGWIGLFVTALNLLPFGQLDGGHILYALAGRRQRLVGRAALLALLPLGFFWWGWWLWATVAVVVSRGRVGHPPVLHDEAGLGRGRRQLGWAAAVIFFLSFIPLPVRI